MKCLLYKIMCSLVMLFFIACSESTLNEAPELQSGKILLQVSSDIVVSRTVEDVKSNHEYDLSHLDILIFNSNSGNKVYHERIDNPAWGDNDGKGQVSLNATDDLFNGGAITYDVYVVANSSKEASIYAGLSNFTELKNLQEETPNLHLTGLHESIHNVPATFLMDGKAYVGGSENTAPVPINLQNNDVELNVILRRAASKVMLTFSPQSGVEFLGYTENNAQPGYYVRNLPVKTYVLTGQGSLVSNSAATTETSSNYYTYQRSGDDITAATITLYVYSHSWTKDNIYSEGTNLILNLPVKYNNKEYLNNYYQVPLNRPKETNDNSNYGFDRNTFYAATVKINAPGASSIHTPITVDPLEFSAVPWIEKTINVGGVDGPKYLKVNREEMEMYNVETDATTLKFASSSPVTMTISGVYYIDKFGQRQDIRQEQISQYNMEAITEEGALTGNIIVNSALPTNNTIRYFTIEVKNEDQGIEPRIVTVKQYPLIYITNIQGWYSYRDDFYSGNVDKVTYFGHPNSPYYTIAETYNAAKDTWSLGSYNDNSSYSGYQPNGSGNFWASKVVRKTYTSDNNKGRSDVDYYYYTSKGQLGYKDAENPSNARMYHVRVTSSDKQYVVGRPRLDSNGYTADETDSPGNKHLVSPSFMIASRLGFVFSGTLKSKEMAQSHCKYYVEVYKDDNEKEVHLKDWRLPTEEEIKIIIQLQGSQDSQADAIDYLLNADAYYSASGPVSTKSNGSTKDPAVRCVRDAYPQNISTTDVE